MKTNLIHIDCPCCKYGWSKYLELHTEWGYEDFMECQNCGVIFRPKQVEEKEKGGI